MALMTAQTTCGIVRGVPAESNPEHTVFRGIPYAKPPVGDLRFAPPAAPDPWEGERFCGTFSPACIQNMHHLPGGGGVSEDCLYLNVFTPAKSAGEKLPVLFWLFGGGFAGGSSGDPEFDGEAMNQLGAVVVTINYRCAMFGFFTLPELVERNGFAGNVGLLDQIAALEWVRDNIEAFGGDPDRVLVFGQSAGGISTRMLLCSPAARGLFSRAVIESGGGLNEADLVRPRDEFTQLCQEAVRYAGYTFEDLMSADALELHAALWKGAKETAVSHEINYFQPFVDGRTLTRVPGESIAEGDYMDIPIINMTVAGDAWMFTRKVREGLGDNMNYYRAFSYSPSQAWGQVQVEKGRTPIYTAYMERTQPMDSRRKAGVYGAQTPHGSEVAYVFGTLDKRSSSFDAPEKEISRMLTSYWVNFAATGDPNGPGLPYWPLYTKETPFALHVGDEGVQAGQLVLTEDEQHVLDYTKAHPGMLCSLEGF